MISVTLPDKSASPWKISKIINEGAMLLETLEQAWKIYGSITPGGMVIYHLDNSYLLHTLMERLRFPLQRDFKKIMEKFR